MYDVSKNIVLILLAFFAPYWFPITQKIFNGNYSSITSTEWLFLLLVFIAPILGLWYGQKENERIESAKRIKEMKEAFVEALKEYGVAKTS